MKALRFTNGNLSLSEVTRPDNKTEALIRVVKSGICNTDLEIVRGYAGFEGTIGHEFVGVVERADDRPEIVGKRVVGEINAGCGTCELCLAGDPTALPDSDRSWHRWPGWGTCGVFAAAVAKSACGARQCER